MIQLIQHVKLFREGEWRDSDILLAGQKIAAVEDRIEISLPGLEVKDGQGMRAVSGYVDRHVHITGGGGEGGFSNEVPPISICAPLQGGVTTVVGLLGTDGLTRSVESLAAKAMALEEEGITAYFLTGAYSYPSPTITGSVKKDSVMLKNCLGVKLAISDHRAPCIQSWELARLAADTWQAGILKGHPAFLHLHVGRGKTGLSQLFQLLEETDLPISVFHPTHMGNQIEDAVRFSKLGGWVDFTVMDDPERSAEQMVSALTRCPPELVTFSTDSNGSMPIWNDRQEMVGISACRISNLHATVQALVQQKGLPLEQAVLPCTCNAARALNLPGKGRLTPGADGDILLLDDRLEIQSVFALGKELLREGALTFQPKFSDS